MDTQWIKDAFEKAEAEAVDLEPISVRVCKNIDEKTTPLLMVWENKIGRGMMTKIALLCSEDDKLQDALIQLSKIFFMGGYLCSLDDVKNGEIVV